MRPAVRLRPARPYSAVEAPTGEVLLTDRPTIVDLLVLSGLAGNKGAARRTVREAVHRTRRFDFSIVLPVPFASPGSGTGEALSDDGAGREARAVKGLDSGGW